MAVMVCHIDKKGDPEEKWLVTEGRVREPGGARFRRIFFGVGIRKKNSTLPYTNNCDSRGVAKNTKKCESEEYTILDQR